MRLPSMKLRMVRLYWNNSFSRTSVNKRKWKSSASFLEFSNFLLPQPGRFIDIVNARFSIGDLVRRLEFQRRALGGIARGGHGSYKPSRFSAGIPSVVSALK